MMEWFLISVGSLGTGALTFYSGIVFGRRVAKATARPAICPCGHPIGTHVGQKDDCTGQIRRAHYLASGDRNGSEYVACDCKHYSGPELLPSVTFRELEGS